uniref:Uncharacterized protein n=1 Tax=Mycena chlorophos TaxID=658473 RepID=A0ABQ0LIR7_MYCCL|nr:predicted protein [Mycena chlorophos]
MPGTSQFKHRPTAALTANDVAFLNMAYNWISAILETLPSRNVDKPKLDPTVQERFSALARLSYCDCCRRFSAVPLHSVALQQLQRRSYTLFYFGPPLHLPSFKTRSGRVRRSRSASGRPARPHHRPSAYTYQIENNITLGLGCAGHWAVRHRSRAEQSSLVGLNAGRRAGRGGVGGGHWMELISCAICETLQTCPCQARPELRAFEHSLLIHILHKTEMSHYSSRASSPTMGDADAYWSRPKSVYSAEELSFWDRVCRFFGGLSCTDDDYYD